MEQTVPATDQVRRFIFENRPVRGHWVRLESAWSELRAHADYPPAVRDLLGEATAACVLLAAALKFQGTLSLQLRGEGAVRLLLAQCTHDFRLRAVARCNPEAVAVLPAAGPELFQRLVGRDGRLEVTIEVEEKRARSQGIVPLGHDSLAASLEDYFSSSEQLPTRVLLAADDRHASGLLVQQLPGSGGTGEAAEEEVEEVWEEAEAGIQRLGAHELLQCPVEELLARGFGASDLRLFRGSPAAFECRCTPERVAGLLRSLGEEEVQDILREQGRVTVTCEFCHRPYHYDPVDVGALFADSPGAGPGGSRSVH